MKVLGVNSYFEHPAVALVADGELVFAAEDERFTRVKHGRRYSPYGLYLPVEAMHAALSWAGMTTTDLDEIAYSYDRWTHLRNLWGCLTGRRLSSLRDELAGFASLTNLRPGFHYAVPERYRDVVDPAEAAAKRLRAWPHHVSHAGSAFLCSEFEEALVIVADGAGEAASTSVFFGRGTRLAQIGRERIPNSLGLFYSFVTSHLGFEPFADEYKVMGLAAYGEPRFAGAFGELLAPRPQGSYALDVRRLQNPAPLLGPRRRVGEPIEQRHMDVARSAQQQLEQVLAHLVGHYARATGARRLCLAGGTFLNCVANGALARQGMFEEIFVQPAAHDAGTAIGAAALSAAAAGDATRVSCRSMALGTEYDDAAVAAVLADAGVGGERLEEDELISRTAAALAENNVCALFRGRMEFGPRALGRRSILANPADPEMQRRLNSVKGREQFRPVAPAVTSASFPQYFDGEPSSHMMFAARARERALTEIPAAIHVDGSARPQVVEPAGEPFLHALLESFAERSGFPVLINTSFNGKEEPIVESPKSALACFAVTGIDCLVIGSYFVQKEASRWASPTTSATAR